MRVLTLIALALVASACSSTVRPRVSLPPTQVEALQAFDYADWTRITTTLVDARGRVDYPKLAADRAGLDRFIALIAVVGPKSKPALFPTREDQLAYYINAYNALTMFNVINRYPAIQSVNDDPKDFFYFTEFELDGGEIDLSSLENKIIRPTFQDARVHFALNCASAGCPVLPAEPFLPATLEAQLSREATRFLHEERNVAVEGGAIVLSQIFEWYAADFTPDPVSWIRAQAGDLDLPATAIVRHRPYDWALNDQSRP